MDEVDEMDEVDIKARSGLNRFTTTKEVVEEQKSLLLRRSASLRADLHPSRAKSKPRVLGTPGAYGSKEKSRQFLETFPRVPLRFTLG